jgi:fibronectin-binding autotransporter adhesin
MLDRRSIRVVVCCVVVAGFAGGASPSVAATETSVDCGSGADLQAAINAASKGEILDISGRCMGSFTVAKNLTLNGVSAAVLDAGSSSSGPSTDPTLTIAAGHVRVKTLTITGANTSSFQANGGLLNLGTAVLVRVTIQGNTGGGLTNRGTLTMQRSTVTGNESDDGAAVSNIGTATIEKTSVRSNPGSNGITNGSWGTATGTLTLVDSSLSDNHSGVTDGGGVFNGINSTATIRRSTISGNGVFNNGPGAVGNAGTVAIIESTISANYGDGYGGGLFTFESGSTTVAATILSGNMLGGVASDCGGPLISQGYNLIGSPTSDDTNCTYTPRGTDQTGILDPILKPLGNYGGPTQTMKPLASSPAVDAIPIGALTAEGTTPLCPATGSRDQRGKPRPNGPACDIGSVEK